MFTKMRAIIAAERKRADEAEKQLADYRQWVEEERRRLEGEHRQHLAAETRRREEERQRRAEEYRHQLAAESRRREEEHQAWMRQNDEMHREMLAALTELTAVISQLRQDRNGNRR
ncbi:MAG: hypothetical protein OXL37_09460 [Chloroflexota bacterium]|nr:hypothetical protein [Chloroflexota bacterium]MDE2960087.1 hypothetical protein [Chloroflexota bacterium]